jgi:hypothetical protein
MITIAILTTFILLGLHVGHKEELPITVKLSFEYNPAYPKNSYKILFDGKLVQQFVLQDNGDPLAEFEETRLDFKKGQHKIIIEFEEGNTSHNITRNFTENTSFQINNGVITED